MAFISKSIQDNHKVTIVMDRKSYMKFHFAPLSFTWRRQIEVRHISEGHNMEPLANTANLLSMMDKKSYMVFHFVAFALT